MEPIFEKSTKEKKSKITTIKVDASTKERMEHLRVYKRESYDEIMKNILEVLNICRVNPERARSRLILIDKERKRNLKESK
jgi:hypothetical protein